MTLRTIILVLTLLVAAPAMAQQGKTTITDSTTTALFLNAMKEYNSGNLQKAKEHLQLLLAIDSNNDAACYYLANISIKTDDIVSGELYLKKGIGIDSSNFWYRDMLGQIYIKNKKLKEAIKVYEELLALYPKKSAVYYSLINLYLGAQETDNARKMLAKIEAAQGKSEAVAMTSFQIYRMEQNWEGGLNYLV
ncbi:MAG: tetratricopeptide repeat protein, partial [Bacteroidales bacterium]|nr:tetratricopeptide repeat protein [Bacteroidales bacterium]